MSDALDNQTNIGKVYKANVLIKADFTKTKELAKKNVRADLTLSDAKVFNLILQKFQKKIRELASVNPLNLNVEIHISDFKGFFSDKNWKNSVKTSIERIISTSAVLKNIKIPKAIQTGGDICFNKNMSEEDFIGLKWHAAPLIIGASEYDNNPDIIKFRFDPLIAYYAWIKKEYTHISLDKIKHMKSKYSQRLYEFLEYYIGINRLRDHPSIKIELNTKQFQEIMHIPDKKTAPSTLIQKVNRNNILMEDMQNIYPEFTLKNIDGYIEITFKKEVVRSLFAPEEK